ncbi:hypothetical protein GCM10017779_42700 [Streptomyces capillispiralis]|nr:hypothetical protein GCM10017779_42700 [Streptomyces capillispiralis]
MCGPHFDVAARRPVGGRVSLDEHRRGLLRVDVGIAVVAPRVELTEAARGIDAQVVRFYGPFELAIAVRNAERRVTPTTVTPPP